MLDHLVPLGVRCCFQRRIVTASRNGSTMSNGETAIHELFNTGQSRDLNVGWLAEVDNESDIGREQGDDGRLCRQTRRGVCLTAGGGLGVAFDQATPVDPGFVVTWSSTWARSAFCQQRLWRHYQHRHCHCQG